MPTELNNETRLSLITIIINHVLENLTKCNWMIKPKVIIMLNMNRQYTLNFR